MEAKTLFSSCSLVASRPRPLGLTLICANWVHTAVTSKKAVRQLIRSMNGTTLMSTSTFFLPPLFTETPMSAS